MNLDPPSRKRLKTITKALCPSARPEYLRKLKLEVYSVNLSEKVWNTGTELINRCAKLQPGNQYAWLQLHKKLEEFLKLFCSRHSFQRR